MRSFTVTTALLLCSLSWISVSGSQTVNVQPGEEVTLMCSNNSGSPTHIFWSKLDNTTKISCISSMYGFGSTPEFCTGFQNGKFHMSSNISVVFLKIKQVDLSDSGLYLCGYYNEGHTIIDVRQLNVEGKGNDKPPSDHDDAQWEEESDATGRVTSVILGGVTVLLLLVTVVLIVENGKLHRANNEKQYPQKDPDLDSDELKAATIRRRMRSASEREVEAHVIYTASR